MTLTQWSDNISNTIRGAERLMPAKNEPKTSGAERNEPLMMPKTMEVEVSQRLMAGMIASLNGDGNTSPVALRRRASGSMVSKTMVTRKTTVIRAAILNPMRSRYWNDAPSTFFREKTARQRPLSLRQPHEMARSKRATSHSDIIAAMRLRNIHLTPSPDNGLLKAPNGLMALAIHAAVIATSSTATTTRQG